MLGNASLNDAAHAAVPIAKYGHLGDEESVPLGKRVSTNGRRFTVRKSGTLIRVVSARDMHRKEEGLHDQQT